MIRFDKWHTFLGDEILAERLNVRVFTVNNHYLCHLEYIVKNAGPLKAYSCRNLERTIKKYSNLIKSKSRINANASNTIRSQAGYNSHHIRGLTSGLVSGSGCSPSSYLDHPSGLPDSPQLLAPFMDDTLLDDTCAELVCCGLIKSKVVRALQHYYMRTAGYEAGELGSMDVVIAARAWKDSKQFSSEFDRKAKNLHTRAGHIVLFDVSTNRR